MSMRLTANARLKLALIKTGDGYDVIDVREQIVRMVVAGESTEMAQTVVSALKAAEDRGYERGYDQGTRDFRDNL